MTSADQFAHNSPQEMGVTVIPVRYQGVIKHCDIHDQTPCCPYSVSFGSRHHAGVITRRMLPRPGLSGTECSPESSSADSFASIPWPGVSCSIFVPAASFAVPTTD